MWTQDNRFLKREERKKELGRNNCGLLETVPFGFLVFSSHCPRKVGLLYLKPLKTAEPSLPALPAKEGNRNLGVLLLMSHLLASK